MEGILLKKLNICLNILSQSLITLRLEKNAYLVIIKCSSCFSIAQGPNILCKENTKLQHKLSLCLLFFLGVSEIIFYFFIQYYVITMIANCGKDWFSQIGIGLGSSVYTSGLTYKLYLNVMIRSFKLPASYQAFHQGACNTTLLFIHD